MRLWVVMLERGIDIFHTTPHLPAIDVFGWKTLTGGNEVFDEGQTGNQPRINTVGTSCPWDTAVGIPELAIDDSVDGRVIERVEVDDERVIKLIAEWKIEP